MPRLDTPHPNDKETTLNSIASYRRLVRAAWLQVFVISVGTAGFHILTDESHDLLDALYFTVITVTTVGYYEIIPIAEDQTLQIFNIGLIIVGMAAVLYFVSVLAAFLIEGGLQNLFRRRSMDKEITKLRDHYIVAGLGRTGTNIAAELIDQGAPCVLIDQDEEKLKTFLRNTDGKAPYVVGDATDDDVLASVGVHCAQAVAFCLGDDRENLFATISAHRINDDLRIITKGNDPRSEEKFLMAGASSVIFINELGGRHMAAELVRPEVTNFLSLLFSHPERDHDIKKVDLGDQSPYIGKTVADIELDDRQLGLLIAVIDSDDQPRFNPPPDYVLEAHSQLVFLAEDAHFDALREYLLT